MTTNLDALKNRDFVLLIDKSGSMTTKDVGNGWSRWKAVRESTKAIAEKISEFDPDGITVMTFAATTKKWENVTPSKVDDIFSEGDPMGGTALAPALKEIFADFTKRKKAGTTKANGEMLICITDGSPDDEDQVANEIVKFANTLENPDNEYGIAFLQIGKDEAASKFLQRLDDGLAKAGAKHDIVDTKTFDEVEKLGLTETLLAALND